MPRVVLALCVCLMLIGAFSHAYASGSGSQDAGAQDPHASRAAMRRMGPLHTSGAKLFDADGQEVRITGVNWFGLETDTFAPHGLWARNYEDMLDQMVRAGFNTIRLPYTNQLFDSGSTPRGIDFQKNLDLQGLNGLQIMDRVVAAAGQRGLGVILDRHRPTTAGQSELWYTRDVPESRWIQDWVMLAEHYAGNPAVIGADLHNEPHGPATWGDDTPATDWRLAAERAGNAILAANPEWLIIVEGIEHYGNDWYWWGGNLAGVRDATVRLSAPGKLVYSTHDYGPGVYQQSWFGAPAFPANLPAVWHEHWAFLQQEDSVPVLVGEFGGRSVGSDAEGIWQRSLLGFLRDNYLSYTYWAWNPDSGDTGGILSDDWSTLDQRKLVMLSGYQWPLEARGPLPTNTASSVAAAALPTETATGVFTVVPTSEATSAMAVAPPLVAQPATSPITFAAGGPFDPDLQHVLQGIGGLNDPDQVHRQARERDERRYLADFGKPWQYATYVVSTAGL